MFTMVSQIYLTELELNKANFTNTEFPFFGIRLVLQVFHSSIAIILMGKRELIVLFNLSSWCLVMVERLFLAVPRSCLRFVIVVFPDHTHLLFL